jgi:hypothetical protein
MVSKNTKPAGGHRNWLRVPALALVFALALAGCDWIAGDGEGGYPYTFRFKVDNNTHLYGGAPKTITKVEFINGDTRNDLVLYQSGQPVTPGGARSTEHHVSGFTIEYSPSTRIFGVQVTFEGGTRAFAWSHAGHGQKILVSVNPPDYFNLSVISFSLGNW